MPNNNILVPNDPNGNGIYIPHFLYVYIQMRFTFKSCARVRSAYIGAEGSRYQSISDLTRPTQPINHEIAQRPDQHTGNSTPYSLR